MGVDMSSGSYVRRRRDNRLAINMPAKPRGSPPKRRTDQWLHQERIRLESARQRHIDMFHAGRDLARQLIPGLGGLFRNGELLDDTIPRHGRPN